MNYLFSPQQIKVANQKDDVDGHSGIWGCGRMCKWACTFSCRRGCRKGCTYRCRSACTAFCSPLRK